VRYPSRITIPDQYQEKKTMAKGDMVCEGDLSKFYTQKNCLGKLFETSVQNSSKISFASK